MEIGQIAAKKFNFTVDLKRKFICCGHSLHTFMMRSFIKLLNLDTLR